MRLVLLDHAPSALVARAMSRVNARSLLVTTHDVRPDEVPCPVCRVSSAVGGESGARLMRLFDPLFRMAGTELDYVSSGSAVGLLGAGAFEIALAMRTSVACALVLEELLSTANCTEILVASGDGRSSPFGVFARSLAHALRVPLQAVESPLRGSGIRGALGSLARRAIAIGGPSLGAILASSQEVITLGMGGAGRSRRRLRIREPLGDPLEVAMLVYHPKGWQYLLPIRARLLELGHEVSLLSPRRGTSSPLRTAGLPYARVGARLPKLRELTKVVDWSQRMVQEVPWGDSGLERSAGALKDALVAAIAGAACEYLRLAPSIAAALRERRPAVAVSTDCGSLAARCFLRTAEALDVPTVFVQHGALIRGATMPYYFTDAWRLLWGATSKEALERAGVPGQDRNVVVGSGFLESELFGRPRARVKNLAVVAFGVPGGVVSRRSFALAASEVLTAANENPSVAFAVKPHPGDRSGFWENLLKKESRPNVFLTEEDVYGLLSAASLLVTMYSTTGSEALALGIPVVSIDLEVGVDGVDYLEWGAAYRVSRPGGLGGVVREVMSAEWGRDELAPVRDSFARAFLERPPGGALARSTHEVLRIASGRS